MFRIGLEKFRQAVSLLLERWRAFAAGRLL